MSRSTGPLRPVLAVLVLAALAAALPQSLNARAADPGPRALAAAAKPETARSRGRTPLPDSVLARVGRDRDITLTEFRRAWTQVSPPSRPDSLTPQTAREFLDLMIGKEALGEEALQVEWEWTAQESARVSGLRDRLMMALVLDSALRVTQAVHVAEGGDSLSSAELGTLARDEAIRQLNVRFDEVLLARLARAWAAIPKPPADSGIFAALRGMGRDPEIAEADMDLVIAETAAERITVRDLSAYWKRLNPLTRPRIEAAPQLREVIANAMYEDILRTRAEAQGYGEHPDIVRHIAKEAELIAVTHLVQRDVYGKIPVDQATLEKYYMENLKAWDLPPRVRVLRLVMPDRAQAAQMLETLRDAERVDSLTARAQRVGLSYEAEYSADIDSAMFATGMRLGVGAVMGPDSTERGWAVSRVIRILPGAPRPFAEVRELVQHAMYGQEGERLMQELLAAVRAKVPYTVNEPAVARAGAR